MTAHFTCRYHMWCLVIHCRVVIAKSRVILEAGPFMVITLTLYNYCLAMLPAQELAIMELILSRLSCFIELMYGKVDEGLVQEIWNLLAN